MNLSREAFFEQADFLIKYVKTKAPLPSWMRGRFIPETEQNATLSVTQQLAHGISRDLEINGIDPDSKEGRERFSETMKDVLNNYDWLN